MYPVEDRKPLVILFPRANSCELLPAAEHFYQGRFLLCYLLFSLDNRPQIPFSIRTRDLLCHHRVVFRGLHVPLCI